MAGSGSKGHRVLDSTRKREQSRPSLTRRKSGGRSSLVFFWGGGTARAPGRSRAKPRDGGATENKPNENPTQNVIPRKKKSTRFRELFFSFLFFFFEIDKRHGPELLREATAPDGGRRTTGAAAAGAAASNGRPPGGSTKTNNSNSNNNNSNNNGSGPS